MLLRLGIVLGIAGLLLLLGLLARRYERSRLKEGTWDENGPKNPDSGPEDYSWSQGHQAFDWFNRWISKDSRDAKTDRKRERGEG